MKHADRSFLFLGFAMAALAGCAPQMMKAGELNVPGRSEPGMRGATVLGRGEERLTASGYLRNVRIVSGADVQLGRAARGQDYFDPAKAPADLGSLAEWASKKKGLSPRADVPGAQDIPSAGSREAISWPTLEELGQIAPTYLESPDPRLRAAGAIAAAHSRRADCVPRLCELVASNDVTAVVCAEALGAIGDPRAVPALSEALRRTGPLAIASAGALGALGGPSAARPLIRALSSPNYGVRMAAARALGSAGGREAGRAVAAVAENEDELVEVRLAAAASAARLGLGSRVQELLLRHASSLASPERARLALAGLSHVRTKVSAEALGAALARSDGDLWLTALWGLLGGLREAGRELEIRAGDRNPRVRERARLGMALAGALCTWDDGRPRRPAEALCELLGSSDPAVRGEAVSALGFAGGEADLSAIERVLDEDPDLRVRRAAAASIGRLGRKEGLAALTRAAGSEDPILRAIALAGIAAIRGEDVSALAKPDALASAELAEQRRALSEWKLERVVVSGRERAAEMRSPRGTRFLVKPGDQVWAGFSVAAIVAAGERPSASEEPAERGRVVLAKDGASVVIHETGPVNGP